MHIKNVWLRVEFVDPLRQYIRFQPYVHREQYPYTVPYCILIVKKYISYECNATYDNYPRNHEVLWTATRNNTSYNEEYHLLQRGIPPQIPKTLIVDCNEEYHLLQRGIPPQIPKTLIASSTAFKSTSHYPATYMEPKRMIYYLKCPKSTSSLHYHVKHSPM